MAHRQDTGRMMRPSPLVVALALLIVMVGIVIGVVRSLAVSGADVPQVEIPVPVVNPPEATNTPKPTETNTPEPTSTPTVTPTATPTPRTWTREQYEEFMFGNGGFVFNQILVYGWYLHDGVEVLDDFPCLRSCFYDTEEARQVVREAYDQNNSADFWCEWSCQAVANHFGSPWNLQKSDIYSLNELTGIEGREPFCPQFVDPTSGLRCDTPLPEPTPFPLVSFGWSDEQRAEIENKYLYTILADEVANWPGMVYRFPGWDWPYWTERDWTREDMSALPDTLVCWLIANGHYYYGFPEYDIPLSQHDNSKVHGLRMELRQWLNSQLGVSVDGNPPLCPGFLDMIEPAYLP